MLFNGFIYFGERICCSSLPLAFAFSGGVTMLFDGSIEFDERGSLLQVCSLRFMACIFYRKHTMFSIKGSSEFQVCNRFGITFVFICVRSVLHFRAALQCFLMVSFISMD